jgi:competence protein ComEC
VKISFKNVGQGDSIVLEWQSKGQERCGIIDCNRYKGGNPVIEHLKRNQVKELTFVFLTHPHGDHFSGMNELLDYCDTNNVQIRRFVHTLRSDPRLIRSLNFANLKTEDSKQLHALLKQLQDLYHRKVIVEMGNAEVDWSIQLNPTLTIRNLSPSEHIIHSYLAQVQHLQSIDLARCSRLANLLSAILCIDSVDGTKALLTSDAEVVAFEHLMERHAELFDGQLVLAQIPHHGSLENHKEEFWGSFEKEVGCPAVVSSGENRKYEHPDLAVIQAFEALNFSVSATNDVHGFKENRLNKASLKLSNMLDDESEVVIPEIAGSDIVIELFSASTRPDSRAAESHS